MTSRQKIDAAVAYLKARKVGAGTAAPPLYRLLWSLGVYVPPPHFQNFFVIATSMGSFFGGLMGVFFAFQHGSWELNAVSGLGCGVLFGLSMATYFRWSAAKLGLPKWADFDPKMDEEKSAGDEW